MLLLVPADCFLEVVVTFRFVNEGLPKDNFPFSFFLFDIDGFFIVGILGFGTLGFLTLDIFLTRTSLLILNLMNLRKMVLSFHHILVPYDGTKSSSIAFDAGLKIAKKNHSLISVITCIEEKKTLGFFQTKSDKKEFERVKKQVDRHFSKLQKEAEKLELKFKSKITKSDYASDCIVDYAKENNVSLIVISKTKLKTELEKRHYDSTVENIFKKNPCSVLVVK